MIEQSEQLDQLGAALAKAQSQIKSALKENTVKTVQHSYRYADFAAVVEASRPALTENGIAVVQMPLCDPETGRVIVSTMLLHASGQWLRSATSANPRDLSPQSVGSAISYLKRYGLSAMVGVVSEEDDDAQAAQPASNGSNGHTSQAMIATASSKQLNLIRTICREIQRNPEDAAEYYFKCKLEDLTSKQASELITTLNELKAKL